jgi:hypothetical protein
MRRFDAVLSNSVKKVITQVNIISGIVGVFTGQRTELIDPFSDAPRPEQGKLSAASKCVGSFRDNPSAGGQTSTYSHAYYSIDLSY